MRSSIALPVALLLAVFLPFPAATATHGPYSCTTIASATEPYVYCTFTCHVGDYLIVSGEAVHGPETLVSASCGGAEVQCQDVATCAAVSSGPATSSGIGTCYSAWGSRGTCTADLVPPVAGGPVATPERESGSIETPPIPQVCLPFSLLCVGPAGPIHVADTPPMDSVEIVPAWTIDVDLVLQDPQADVEYIPVGPIVVISQPVPVVVCAQTCQVPQPDASGTPYLAVTVTLGSESETYVILP